MKRTYVMVALVLAAALFLLPGPRAQDQAPKAAPPAPEKAPAAPLGPERFVGTLVNQGGGAQLFQAGYFTLQIDRWGTDDEARALMQALQSGGQKALLEKLWKMDQIGFIKLSGTLGYPIIFARSRQTPAGRIVRCLTNRPIAPREFYNMTRSVEYPFGYIEILLPNEGKGEGTLIPTAQVDFTTSGSISVEAFGWMPLRLLDVGVEEAKGKKK